MPAYTTRILGAHDVAEGTRLFRLARPEGFDFRAGQSVNLTLVDPPHTDAKGNMRTFSLVNAPGEGELAIATRMRDTAFKRVLGALPAGSEVKLRGPGGKFTLPGEVGRPVVLVAGGIGITPFMSMLRHEEREGSARPRALIYSSRRQEHAAFLDELQAMATRIPAFRLVATLTEAPAGAGWTGERGMVDKAFLERHVDAASRPIFYLAGPPAMVAALRTVLRERGVDDADIRTDEFFGY